MNYPSPLVALRKSRRALTHRSDDLFVTVHAIRSPVWKAAASTRKWNTETVDDLAALTEGLTGSPYSLPDDPLQRDVVLDAYLSDNTKARELQPDGRYTPLVTHSEPFNSQEYFIGRPGSD